MSKMWQMVLLVFIHYIIYLFLVPSLHCKCLGSKSLQPPNKRNGSNMINSNIWDSPRLMMALDGARNCRVAATQAGMRLYEPSLHSGRGWAGAGWGVAVSDSDMRRLMSSVGADAGTLQLYTHYLLWQQTAVPLSLLVACDRILAGSIL